VKALFFFITLLLGIATSFAKKPTPPELWKDYDPDKGEFKEEIISEKFTWAEVE